MFTKLKLVGTALATVLAVSSVTIPMPVFAAGKTGSTQVEVTADDSNLVVTVPTVIPFVMHADGTLTSSDVGEVVNDSNFAIHVKSVSVTPNKPFTIVADASGEVEEDNVVSFKFGKSGHEIDAHTQVVEDGQYNLSPASVADGSNKFAVSASGFANRVNAFSAEKGHWEIQTVYEKRYVCNGCNASFENIEDIMIHTSEVCGTGYRRDTVPVEKKTWVVDVPAHKECDRCHVTQ